LLIVIHALRITVKPALGNYPFVKLKLVIHSHNGWLLNEGVLTGTGTVTLWLLSICANDNRPIPL